MTDPVRLLSVEHSPSDAALVMRHLERAGLPARWERVETGPDLRASLERGPWDAVLCDRAMPGLGGLEALALVRASGHDLPFIFVSGTMGEDVAVEAMRAGAHDYVLKGDLRRLAPAIEREVREAEARRASARAEAERLRLAAAVEQATDCVIITDPLGAIRYVNPAFERTTGYAAAEVLGQNPRLLKSGRQDAAFYRELWARLGRGEAWTGLLTNRRKDGTLYEVQATITPLRDAAGRTVDYVAVERDVTRELQLEAQLRHAQKMEAVGRLAGGVAHDFNNLLTVIVSAAELALGSVREADPLRAHLADVQAAARRAGQLTRQLLAVSRKQVLAPEPLDLSAVVEGTAGLLRRLLRADIGLVQRLAPDPGLVRADRGQLEQVLMNLVLNARDAMPGGGTLTLETASVALGPEQAARHVHARPGPYVRLSVTDTGVGMDEATLARLFEPFFTTKPVGKGTGLGLSTVYGIVRQSGGHLDVASAPGQGATFAVYLPRDDAAARCPITDAPRRAPAPPSGTETVLIVEDEERVRGLARTVLEQAGFTALTAADGVEALREVERHPAIDLLLTDVVMPRLGGPALVERLRAARPDLKVLYMSGYAPDDAFVRGAAADPTPELLSKPFTPAALVRRVRDVLDGRRAPS